MKSARIEKTAEFLPVFQRFLSLKKPALIEIKMDPEQITTQKTMTEITNG
jgi:thiamine pyrophosphate-dependent acetolactate synthase large subunit-like protein